MQETLPVALDVMVHGTEIGAANPALEFSRPANAIANPIAEVSFKVYRLDKKAEKPWFSNFEKLD